MRVKPLTGQVLIEVDPPETTTFGGIAIPDHTASAYENQIAARTPSMPPPLTGKVVEIGPWPKLKNGLAVLPPFGIGARVVIRAMSGTEFLWETACRLKMVSTKDVLAVLT